jgi:hypothetical protein
MEDFSGSNHKVLRRVFCKAICLLITTNAGGSQSTTWGLPPAFLAEDRQLRLKLCPQFVRIFLRGARLERTARREVRVREGRAMDQLLTALGKPKLVSIRAGA